MQSRMPVLYAVTWLTAVLGGSVQAADAERGRMLYELRCGECHSQSVHGRAQRDAKRYGDVLAYVVRWNAQLNIGWQNDDIHDVAKYVNDTYYGFKCEGPAC